MFNFVDDFVASFTGNFLHKLQIKKALLFFDSQKRKNVLTQRFFFRPFASPFIKKISRTFALDDTSRNSHADMVNQLLINRCDRNLTTKIFLTVSIVSILITDKVSISINNSCQPFIKTCAMQVLFTKSNFNIWMIWLFAQTNRCRKLQSVVFSICSRFMKIFSKKKKLFLFYTRMRRNAFDKKQCLMGNGIYFPSPCFFSILSFSCINGTSKMLFEKIWYFFISHLYAYRKRTILIKRKRSFCIKNTCKILHDKLTLLVGKLHCNEPDVYPQRLNAMERGSILRYAIV